MAMQLILKLIFYLAIYNYAAIQLFSTNNIEKYEEFINENGPVKHKFIITKFLDSSFHFKLVTIFKKIIRV
jgi:hypothetical protein